MSAKSARVFRGDSPLVTRVNPLDQPNMTIEDQAAPAIELPFNFAIQSLFDATVTQYGILPQPKSNQIVQSTLKTKTISCYAVALSPDSECPIAIQFAANGARTKSSMMRLVPGQILRPQGLGGDGKSGSAGGFDFGLPFGWLGGGRGRLIVFKTIDSYLRFVSQRAGSELLFHRITLPIVAADANGVAANWPRAFPWTNAESQLDPTGTPVAAATGQDGTPILTVRPTRTVYELVCNGIGSPGYVGGTINTYTHRDNTTAAPYQSFLTFAAAPAGANSIIILDDGIIDQGAGDDAYVNFVSGDSTTQSLFINIYRYGVLG